MLGYLSRVWFELEELCEGLLSLLLPSVGILCWCS